MAPTSRPRLARTLVHYVAALALAGCATTSPRPVHAVVVPVVSATGEVSLGADVTLHELTTGVWVHTTMGLLPPAGLYPANGLIVVDGGEAVLVDTGWTDSQATRLLDWIEVTRGLHVRAAVVTHAHNDRSGGIAVVRARVPEVRMSEGTARALHLTLEGVFDGSLTLTAGGRAVELFDPGAAHAADNIVAYVPFAAVLFGGCMVRAANATDLGNTADANVVHWPTAIAALARRYPDARFIVPGHGAAGGPELLDHTLSLLREHAE